LADVPSQNEDVTPLEQLIRLRIRDHGPMPVSDYMALALAHPEHGYYRKADPLGRDGDFITAPEISQAFGEIIGLWCVITWQQAGRPSPFHLVELGPGRGTLMADALRAASTVPDFIHAAKIHLVETSPALRHSQEEKLQAYDATWHGAIGTVPNGPCLFIANEFFDALPIDQYVRTADGWNRRSVELDPLANRLSFVVEQTSMSMEGIIPLSVNDAPAGSLFEYCPGGLEIAATMGGRLATDGFAALIIDYGHCYRAAGETLQAVRGHEHHDVLMNPGDADLTAHVDFSELAATAGAAGAVPFGPVSQGTFLSSLGIEERTNKLAAEQNATRANLLHSACHRLIDAQGMGTLFKVLALTDGKLGVPAGFEALTGKPEHRSCAH
jgi:NADH dehydrogenase [ubiquinone] 1 alpha subcomplex assembly factor 7